MGLASLIGRDAEIHETAARLHGNRLVTVVGPGGAGKSSLARVVAWAAAPGFPLGLLDVDLTRVEHDDAVPGAIAAQLGFDSFESLLSSPADQPVLVLLDNCEHLLDAVAVCIVRLLGACRQPSVLATSRSPLELPGESVVSIAPLAVPGLHDEPAGFAAVELFLARMRDAGVDPAGADLVAVAELCRRLDGLPLAVEIAAARTRSLGIADILGGLDDNPTLLDRPRFRGAPRHRGIDDAIRWSYELLSPEAAHLLDRLAVFAGPFTAAGARAVADISPANADDLLDELAVASLVVVDARDRVTRYRLLDTVRRFARQRVREAGALDEAYDRFADHVVVRLGEMLTGATAVWRPGLMRDLVASFDDVAEALRWCVRHDTSPRRAFAMCGALWGLVHQAHADDIARLAESALDRWPDRGTPSGAAAVASLATAAYATGRPERAETLAREALERLTSVGPATVTLHRVLGQSRRALGRLDEASTDLRAGAAVGHELGLTAMALELDVAAAVVAADLGDVDGAVGELHTAIERATAIDSPLTTTWARTALGWVMLRVGVADARPVIEDALAAATAIDYPVAVAAGLRSLTYAQLLRGDRASAVATAQALVDDLVGRAAHSNARLLLDVVAVLAHDGGHDAWRRLVATARAAPITTLLCAHHELVALPAVDEPPLPTRDAVRLVRHVLVELAESSRASRHDGPESTEPTATARASAAGRSHIRCIGDVVEFTFAGRTAATRATKGILDIVGLVTAAGREVHCVDLAGIAVEQASTGEVIDATARREYEQRIRDLQADVDEAEAHSDYARAYRCQVELDALIEHLTAALGYGNRTRRGADVAERARSAVTHRIRGAIRQIASVHPALGSHLGHAINTGVHCSYRPEHAVTWTVDRG
jgi:predicted ATPase